MIQPSLTGPTAGRGRLVHALFATQHCVLGYYQAVPVRQAQGRLCGTLRYKQLSQLGGGRGMHIVPNCVPLILPWISNPAKPGQM
jgi:hypothetical protein